MNNRKVSWCFILWGIFMGMVMGFWSFNGPVTPPSFLEGYSDVSRRFLRLSHIACFGLSFINLLLFNEMQRIPRNISMRQSILNWMNWGNITMPLVLLMAVFIPPLKYFLTLPALLVFAATGTFTWQLMKPQLKEKSHDDD